MTIVYIVGGLVVGLLIGYLIGFMMLNKNRAVWEEEFAGARRQIGELKKLGTAAIQQAQARAQAAEEKLGRSGGEMGKLRDAVTQAQAQLEQQQGALQELQGQHATTREAAEAHKNGRQQAENRYRKAEAALSEAQQQIIQMGSQLEKVGAEHVALKESAQRQIKQLQRLRGDAASARGSSSGLDESVELFAGTDGSLEGVLGVLLDNEGQNTAVVADSNGIIIAATGDDVLKEGIAATTQMVRTSVKQLEGMVPFDDLRSYMLMDEGSNVIAGRFFHCAGENVGLVTYGPRAPSDRTLDGAMANVSSILE